MTFAYHAGFEHGPIELKGDEADPAEAVAKAIGDLNTLVENRFKALETKSAERLDKFEARMNRPTGAAETKVVPAIEQKAFAGYLRGGRESLSADEVKSLTVADTASAGYLAPPQFGSELLKLLIQYSPIRSYANVKSIAAPSIIYPRRVSSLSATWTAETTARTESQPAFDQVTLVPFELATYVDVSNQLLEDNTYDLEGELYAEFAEQFGKAEGAAFVNGTGGTQPKGLLAADNLVTLPVTATVNGSAPNQTIYLTNWGDTLIQMFHSLPAAHAQSGVWMMNRNMLADLRQIKDSVGRYLVLDGLSEGAPVTLLGRPIVEAVDMLSPALETACYPIIFGDMKGYRIVDRVGISILRDPYSIATTGQTRFHARKRVGADVTHTDRFVKLKVTTPAS